MTAGEGKPVVLVFCGVIALEAEAAHRELREQGVPTGLLQVTSPDILYQDWSKRQGDSRVAELLKDVPAEASLVTILDGHPLALSWLGACYGHKVKGLGVERFGQSGDLVDLYREYGLDAAAVVDAAHAERA